MSFSLFEAAVALSSWTTSFLDGLCLGSPSLCSSILFKNISFLCFSTSKILFIIWRASACLLVSVSFNCFSSSADFEQFGLFWSSSSSSSEEDSSLSRRSDDKVVFLLLSFFQFFLSRVALGGVFLVGLSSSSSSSSLTSGRNGCSAVLDSNPFELSGLLPEGLKRLMIEWLKDLSGLFGGEMLISHGFLTVSSGNKGLAFSSAGAGCPLENSAFSRSSRGSL